MNEIIENLQNQIAAINRSYILEEITSDRKALLVSIAEKTASIDMNALITKTNKSIMEEMEPVLDKQRMNFLIIALHGNSII